MKTLNSTVEKRYAYVKNNVIFDIKSYNNGDSCAVLISEDNVGYITVDGKKLFFDSYVEKGDIYSGGTFLKTIHNEKESSAETTSTLSAYCKADCVYDIAKALINQYDVPYQKFIENLDLLGVPQYMIKQSETYSGKVSPESIQIDFKEDTYDTLKEDEVKKIILEKSQQVAEAYGYDLIKPEDIDSITISERT